MSFLDKIKAKYDEKLTKEIDEADKCIEDYYKMKREIDDLRAEKAAKWASRIHTSGTSTFIGGSPIGVGPAASGHAWVEQAVVEGKCRALMKKLEITTGEEFDKVFGEIIND